MKLQILDSLGAASFSFAAGLAQRLPQNAAYALGRAGGSLCYFFSNRRRFAYADLKAAFGSRYSARELRKIVHDHYRHIGESAVEFLRFPILTREWIENNIQIHNIDAYYRAIEKHKGLVLLTGHVGNWELIQIVSAILGYPVHALMREQKFPKMDRLLNDFRRSRGSGVASTGMGVRELLRALKSEGLIGVLGDQSAGKQQGVIVPLFGRKTTIPTGAFEIAARAGTPVLPAFIIRDKNERHQIFVSNPIDIPEDARKGEDFMPQIKQYVALLEELISANPSQWLWAKKRWKYSWTKRVLVLLDGKPGHVKQSHAVAAALLQVKEQYGRAGVEFPVQQIHVEYRSGAHRKVFAFLAFFGFRWMQSRLWLLRFFLKDAAAEALRHVSVDFVISAGSALVPLNLCLARECCAKSIVCMKPPFPYNYLKYDMAVVPVHDRGHVPAEAVRTYLTPSVPDPSDRKQVIDLTKDVTDAAHVKTALFLGGPSGGYRLDVSVVERIMNMLQRSAQAGKGDFILTTSRRTPDAVDAFLKRNLFRYKACQLAVIAKEDTRPGVVEAMIKMAETLIVTEDSLSMISEAVASGRKVIVLSVDFASNLSPKHRKFTEHLRQKGAVHYLKVNELESSLQDLGGSSIDDFLREEQFKIRKRLQEIL